MYWHDGLGDVYAEVGEMDKAIQQYEQAIGKASSDPLKKPLCDKLEKRSK